MKAPHFAPSTYAPGQVDYACATTASSIVRPNPALACTAMPYMTAITGGVIDVAGGIGV